MNACPLRKAMVARVISFSASLFERSLSKVVPGRRTWVVPWVSVT